MSSGWIELLMGDHETTEKVFAAFGKALEQPDGPTAELVAKAMRYFTEYVGQCHNKKEEEHLFLRLDARRVPRQGGPLAVMLEEHRQSESLLATLGALAERFVAGDAGVLDELRATFRDYSELLKGHFWKENDILYPIGRRVLGAEDDAAILAGIAEVEARFGPKTRETYYALAEEIVASSELRDLAFGLEHGMVAAMLNTLPVELSLVDANDTVVYFSHENGEKIFPRTRGAVGRKVQQCHPPKSVHLVNRILEDFKSGRREVAAFWIDMAGKKVHIRYFPVRAAAGDYLGCLEVVQDIAPLQALTGERRLLDEA